MKLAMVLEAEALSLDEQRQLKATALKLQQSLIARLDKIPDSDVTLVPGKDFIRIKLSLYPNLRIQIGKFVNYGDDICIAVGKYEHYLASRIDNVVNRIEGLVIHKPFQDQRFKVMYSSPVPEILNQNLIKAHKLPLPEHGHVYNGYELFTKKNAPFYKLPSEYRRYFGGTYKIPTESGSKVGITPRCEIGEVREIYHKWNLEDPTVWDHTKSYYASNIKFIRVA
jgi:hypothetical protein